MVELLHRKGVLTKQEILDKISDFRRNTPQGEPLLPSTTKPSPEPIDLTPDMQPFTETENAIIIERIMELVLQHGLGSEQAKSLLRRTIQLVLSI